MRADESPASRRMLRIMEPPGPRLLATGLPDDDAGPEWLLDEPAPAIGDHGGPGTGATTAGPGGGGWGGPGPRLGITGRPALAAVLVAVLGVLVCGWFALRPGAHEEDLPPRPSAAGVPAPAASLPGPGLPVASTSGLTVTATGSVPGAAGPPSPGSIFVYVVGQVRRPGVVSLAAGSRVVDAVEAAGGATARADLAGVNLARKIADGEQILVPRPGQAGDPVTAGSAGPGTAAAGGTDGPAPGGAGQSSVNLNTATAAQLDELPGVGPVIAGRIVSFRQENGPFARVDQLADVEGIGAATLEKLRPLVTV